MISNRSGGICRPSRKRTQAGALDARWEARPLWPGAFTLIELLVVIAIIGILAALLVPSVFGVFEKGNSAKCVSNLRQIYLMSQAFSADTDGYTPQAWWWGSPAIPVPVGTEANLVKYGFDGQKIACPTGSKAAPDLTYGINSRLVMGSPGTWGSRNIYFNTHGVYKFLAFSKPVATLFFCDAILIPGRTYANYCSSTNSADFRHNKKCNAVFVDGHAEALTPEALTNAFSPALLPGQ